ncbi:MAG: hypothetical protein HY815_26930 [Candidatus Riflebacteria bacterium]|nr:hypothetical protein [Candidatus Riflebacteria bacterium]
MKRLVSIALAVLVMVSVFASAGIADVANQKNKASASAAQASPLKTIWDYQDEIGLTDKQIQDMKAILARFQGNLVAAQQKLNSAEGQLKGMIEKVAPMGQIREKLLRIASIQTEMRIEDVETSRKVNAVLTPEQLESWHQIQAKTRAAKRQ